MYICCLEDDVVLSPVARVMFPQSPPYKVNIGNLIKNCNYLLTKNLKYFLKINKRLVNCWMYHIHNNRVCIYSIQIVINKQFFPGSYWFNGTYKDMVSFTQLEYAVGLLKCRPWLCTVYKPHNITGCFWPFIHVHRCSFILSFVFQLYIIRWQSISMHTSCILDQAHPMTVFVTGSNILHQLCTSTVSNLYVVHAKQP